MKRHMIMFNARSGSTVVGNHVAANLCTPAFDFNAHGLPSTEIHDCEYDWYFDMISEINNKYPGIEWCMKWNIMCGHIDSMTKLNEKVNPEVIWYFNFDKVHHFFKSLGVTDLHFTFRHDIIDTLCSFLIAEETGNWVIGKRKKAKYDKITFTPEQISACIDSYDLAYQVYSRSVIEMMDKYDCHFYPYEDLENIIDLDNDPHGLIKQLSKEDKKHIITNYEEVERSIKESRIWKCQYDKQTGVYSFD